MSLKEDGAGSWSLNDPMYVPIMEALGMADADRPTAQLLPILSDASPSPDSVFMDYERRLVEAWTLRNEQHPWSLGSDAMVCCTAEDCIATSWWKQLQNMILHPPPPPPLLPYYDLSIHLAHTPVSDPHIPDFLLRRDRQAENQRKAANPCAMKRKADRCARKNGHYHAVFLMWKLLWMAERRKRLKNALGMQMQPYERMHARW